MTIAKDGLLYYYNSKQGYTSNVWEDLSGNEYHLNMTDTMLDGDGVYFNGSSMSKGVMGSGMSVPVQSSYTLEFALKVPDLTATSYFLYFYRSTGSRALTLTSSELLRMYAESTSFPSTYQVPINTIVQFTIKHVTNNMHALYINGTFRENINTTANISDLTGSLNVGTNGSGHYKGHIAYVRQYNRSLSDTEISNNYSYGLDVGLEDNLPVYPAPLIIDCTRIKISKKNTVDRSIVTFKFDTDVNEWTVRVSGVSYDTGILADSGGKLAAGVNVTAEIDWSELYQEGQNKVNIYGKSKDGHWTQYQD